MIALGTRNTIAHTPQFPKLSEESGCPEGKKCFGQRFCTIIGCVCLGLCIDEDVGQPPPDEPGNDFGNGNGGRPPGAPAPRLGGCPSTAATAASVQCPAGCHPNKSEYCLKSGARVLKGTRCVRNRRRNPLNPRALDRAISRISSAQNAVSRLGFQKKAPRRRKRKKASVC